MPYYQWKGVNLQADTCTGIQFARDHDQLDKLLYKKDIALLSYRTKKFWLTSPVSAQQKNDYFMQLSLLTQAGILLPHALDLVAQQMQHNKFAQIAYEIADRVHEGNLLSAAFSRYKIFDPTMIQMAAVGQESGYLSQAFAVLSQHGETIIQFKNRIRSALLLPVITLCFFVFIFLLILLFIVPQFITIFKTMNKELPQATRTLISLSNFVRSWSCMIMGIGMTIVAYSIYTSKQYKAGKQFFDRCFIKFPLTRMFVINKTFALFFQSLSLLLAGGIPLVQAFKIAKESIENDLIKRELDAMEGAINAGDSFAQVLAHYPYLGNDVIALIQVGQESGTLPQIMTRISLIYQQRLIRILSRITLLMQPLLLLILGLLISALILALYSPIMTFSYAL